MHNRQNLTEAARHCSRPARQHGRPTVEAGLTVDIQLMLRRGWMRDGSRDLGGSLDWSRRGERFASIGYSYDTSDPDHAWLSLNYTLAPYRGEPEHVEQRVTLTATQPNFGGRRWWMICPFSGCRVAKLHLPPGGDRFASRKAWRLGYQSQRMSRRARNLEHLFRLQRKLGCKEGFGNFVSRPKGMWRRTYDRYFEEFLLLQHRCQLELDEMCRGWLRGGIHNRTTRKI